MKVLVVDNYDSFVYTLNDYLIQLGAQTQVVRNDAAETADLDSLLAGYSAVLLSPGPGAPADAGVSVSLVHAALARDIPLLGVCLGHQAIAEALGAQVVHANELMHGKTSLIQHDGSPFFSGVPQRFRATRYHSLAVKENTVPAELMITARTTGGVIMALQHRSARVFGVQFHPESVLTQGGYQMIGNWLSFAGLADAPARAVGFSPLFAAQEPSPVTADSVPRLFPNAG